MENAKAEQLKPSRTLDESVTGLTSYLRQVNVGPVLVTTRRDGRQSLVVVASDKLRDTLTRLLPSVGFNGYTVERLYLPRYVGAA